MARELRKKKNVNNWKELCCRFGPKFKRVQDKRSQEFREESDVDQEMDSSLGAVEW